MARRRPPQPSSLPPEVTAAIAATDLDQLRAATGQLLDLAAARARRRPAPTTRRRRRASRPFGLTVRVDLEGARPPVWRRVELPSTLRLDEVHGAVQALFGWTDSHLHRFALGASVWDRDAEVFLCPYDVEEGDDHGVPERDVRLDEVLAEPGDTLRYVYDYGDEWRLLLAVESVADPVPQARCTGGRGVAPPEDSGGIWAWNEDRRDTAFDPDDVAAALTAWEAERGLPPELADLLQQVAGTAEEAVVRRLLSAADLRDGATGVGDDIAAGMVRRYAWLLDRVGDGLPLTAAGWLPPAVVTEAMEVLWPDDRWIGKRNREDLTEPVRRLRASAQRLGLLRVAKGRLLRTKAGAALRANPAGLWRHVAARAAGRPRDPFARAATALLLLAVAAGEVRDQELAGVLTVAGWRPRDGAPLSRYAVTGGAADLDEVLDVTDALRFGAERPTDGGRVLARVALRAAS